MPFEIQFEESAMTRIAALDAAHTDLLREVRLHVERCMSPTARASHLSTMVDDIAEHCLFEERLMRATEYPGTDAHAATHAHIDDYSRRWISAQLEQLVDGDACGVGARLLVGQILQHTRTDDFAYGEYLRSAWLHHGDEPLRRAAQRARRDHLTIARLLDDLGRIRLESQIFDDIFAQVRAIVPGHLVFEENVLHPLFELYRSDIRKPAIATSHAQRILAVFDAQGSGSWSGSIDELRDVIRLIRERGHDEDLMIALLD